MGTARFSKSLVSFYPAIWEESYDCYNVKKAASMPYKYNLLYETGEERVTVG